MGCSSHHALWSGPWWVHSPNLGSQYTFGTYHRSRFFSQLEKGVLKGSPVGNFWDLCGGF